MFVSNLSTAGHDRATAWHARGDRLGMGTAALDTCAALGVSVLHWPHDAHVRATSPPSDSPDPPRRRRASPPVLLDELEDWVRTPADPADLRARSRELHRRALDAEPAVTHDRRPGSAVGREPWVDLTPAQTPVVTLLVEHLERVVRYESVSAAYESAGGSSHAASLRTLLTRIGARVRPVGLELVTVRRRGCCSPSGRGCRVA